MNNVLEISMNNVLEIGMNTVHKSRHEMGLNHTGYY